MTRSPACTSSGKYNWVQRPGRSVRFVCVLWLITENEKNWQWIETLVDLNDASQSICAVSHKTGHQTLAVSCRCRKYKPVIYLFYESSNARYCVRAIW